MATIGVVALFISATQTQESHPTPEPKDIGLYQLIVNKGQTNTEYYIFNTSTGEILRWPSSRSGKY